MYACSRSWFVYDWRGLSRFELLIDTDPFAIQQQNRQQQHHDRQQNGYRGGPNIRGGFDNRGRGRGNSRGRGGVGGRGGSRGGHNGQRGFDRGGRVDFRDEFEKFKLEIRNIITTLREV